jgi:hypothetical protein
LTRVGHYRLSWPQMGSDSKPAVMTQAEYARHRGKSRQYISQLAKAGVLVMRGGKVDVRASDTVLDDKPVDEVAEPTRPFRYRRLRAGPPNHSDRRAPVSGKPARSRWYSGRSFAVWSSKQSRAG